jgi:hypothetical protein
VELSSGVHDQIFVFCFKIAGFLLWGALSDQRIGLKFTRTIASGPCQSNPSPAELRPYFTVSFETPPTLRARSPYLYSPGTGWSSYTPGHWVTFSSLLRLAGQHWVKVKVTLRLTVSRPVRLGVRRPSGTHDQFFFLLEIFFRHLWVCYFVAHSLTRGRVCNLLLLLVCT